MDNDDHKAFMYIGRFMSDFAKIECLMNELFSTLFNLGPAELLLLMTRISFQKKVELIGLVLNEQDINENRTIKALSKYAIRRNIIAHSQFWTEPEYRAIHIDHVNKKGIMKLPSEFHLYPNEEFDEDIPFDVFDQYHAEMREILDRLSLLEEKCRPLGPIDQYPAALLQAALTDEVVRTSDNVVKGPGWPELEDSD